MTAAEFQEYLEKSPYCPFCESGKGEAVLSLLVDLWEAAGAAREAQVAEWQTAETRALDEALARLREAK